MQTFTLLTIATISAIVVGQDPKNLSEMSCSGKAREWQVHTFAVANSTGLNIISQAETDIDSEDFFMAHPSDLALDSDAKTLYVALDINCVYKFDIEDRTAIAWIGQCGTSGGGCVSGDMTSAWVTTPGYLAPVKVVSNPGGPDLPQVVDRYMTLTQSNAHVTGVIDNVERDYRIVAGNCNSGSADGQFSKPIAAASYDDSSILVADRDNNCLRLVDFGNAGSVSPILGTCGSAPGISSDGPVSEATLATPVGVTVTDSGSIFFIEVNGAIRLIRGGVVTTLGVRTDGGINSAPMATSGERVFIGELDSSRIVELVERADGEFDLVTVAGSEDSSSGFEDGIGSAAKFSAPAGLWVDSEGRLWIADYHNRAIRVAVECPVPWWLALWEWLTNVNPAIWASVIAALIGAVATGYSSRCSAKKTEQARDGTTSKSKSKGNKTPSDIGEDEAMIPAPQGQGPSTDQGKSTDDNVPTRTSLNPGDEGNQKSSVPSEKAEIVSKPASEEPQDTEV